MTDDETIPHNPEVGLPVHPDNDWHLPELIGKIWTSGELQDTLTTLGYQPTDVDPNVIEPCSCLTPVPGTSVTDPGSDCSRCHGVGEAGIVLKKNRRWVNGDAALRLPIERGRIVSPYSAACVVAAMSE